MGEGDALPPLWHWVYFTPTARASEIGPDGHPRRGGFLPPVELPNRMWAGGRVSFVQPLQVGEAVSRVSRILRCERKSGRTGDLIFVTVEHTLSGSKGVAVVEEQDIVYRNAAPAGGKPAGEAVPPQADFRRRIAIDPVLLFRYSALTFNGHRIHYDHPYATKVEGYPGLIVPPLVLLWQWQGATITAGAACVLMAAIAQTVQPSFDADRKPTHRVSLSGVFRPLGLVFAHRDIRNLAFCTFFLSAMQACLCDGGRVNGDSNV